MKEFYKFTHKRSSEKSSEYHHMVFSYEGAVDENKKNSMWAEACRVIGFRFQDTRWVCVLELEVESSEEGVWKGFTKHLYEWLEGKKYSNIHSMEIIPVDEGLILKVNECWNFNNVAIQLENYAVDHELSNDYYLLYRGQENTNWKISSTLYRAIKARCKQKNADIDVSAEEISQLHQKIIQPFASQTSHNIQHLGMSSPYIDLTTDAKTAIRFALGNYKTTKCEKSAVYIFAAEKNRGREERESLHAIKLDSSGKIIIGAQLGYVTKVYASDPEARDNVEKQKGKYWYGGECIGIPEFECDCTQKVEFHSKIEPDHKIELYQKEDKNFINLVTEKIDDFILCKLKDEK